MYQNKEKVIADLRDGQYDVSKDDEAILEQVRMEKSMVERQLSNAKQQLEQLKTEIMVRGICKLQLSATIELQELEISSTAQVDHVTSQLKETEEALNKEKHAHNETKAILSHTKEVSEDIIMSCDIT